jgi:hypothetical protein
MRGQCHAPAAPYPQERPGTHELYYIALNTFVGGYTYSKSMYGMSNIKITSYSEAHMCLLKEPNVALSGA